MEWMAMHYLILLIRSNGLIKYLRLKIFTKKRLKGRFFISWHYWDLKLKISTRGYTCEKVRLTDGTEGYLHESRVVKAN